MSEQEYASDGRSAECATANYGNEQAKRDNDACEAPAAQSGVDPSVEAERARNRVIADIHNIPRLTESLATSERISSIIPKLVSREIPGWCVNGATIETPADFAMLNQAIRSPYFESLKVAFLNQRNRVVHSQILFVGTLNESFVHCRDVMIAMERAAQRTKFRRILIAHNHPSGNVEPSDADRRITRQLEKTCETIGVQFVDHVITNGETFYSFKSFGIEHLPASRLRPWEVVKRSQLLMMDEKEAFLAVVASLRQAAPGASHIIYLNTRNQITGIERVSLNPNSSYLSVNQIQRAVVHGIAREGAHSIMLDLQSLRQEQALSVSRAVAELADLVRFRLLDAASERTESFRQAGFLSECSVRIGSQEGTRHSQTPGVMRP